jgi:hypothetical protein
MLLSLRTLHVLEEFCTSTKEKVQIISVLFSSSPRVPTSKALEVAKTQSWVLGQGPVARGLWDTHWHSGSRVFVLCGVFSPRRTALISE